MALGLVWYVAQSRRKSLEQKSLLYNIEQERAAEREAILTAQKETKEAENRILQVEIEAERKEAVNKALQLSSQEQRLQLIKDKLQKAEDQARNVPKPCHRDGHQLHRRTVRKQQRLGGSGHSFQQNLS